MIDLYQNIYTMKQPKLGEKITALRKQKGLTQEELIEKCNVSVRTIQRIEAGEVTPRSYTLKAILKALDYDFSKIQSENFKITSVEEKLSNFKSNWFQEAKEKHLFVIPLISTTIIMVYFFTKEFPMLTVVFSGGFLGFAFPFYAGYLERGKKHVLQQQLNGKSAIKIKYSWLKLLGVLSVFFVLIIYYGWNIYTVLSRNSENLSGSNWVSIMVFSVALLIFGFFALKTIIKVFKSKFGLIINEHGITDYASGLAVGFIAWSNVKTIEVRTLRFNQKSIKLILNNPEDYIDNYKKGSLKRKIAKESYKRFDSPIQLQTRLLNIRPSQLYYTLNVKLYDYVNKG
jgi:transcriptional regulator with XRE-family HTH domain